MKRQKLIMGIIIVFVLIILGFYVWSEEKIENEDYSLILGEFEDFSFFGSAFYQTNWDKIIDGTASEEEIESVYGDLFNALIQIVSNKTTINEDCINNKESYACLFVYSIINNKESLCDNFPKARLVEVCSRYGCQNETFPYQDACIAKTKLYEKYLEEDKISFCKSLSNNFAQEKCLIYTALKQNDPEVCSHLDSEIGGCYYEVLCRDFPYISEEMYQCRLEVCELSYETSPAELIGCKIGANNSNPEIYN